MGETLIFAAPKRDGAVAQSVEQRTENPCVGGSIPPHTTESLVVELPGFFVYPGFYDILLGTVKQKGETSLTLSLPFQLFYLLSLVSVNA